jgi:DUF1680 family protein
MSLQRVLAREEVAANRRRVALQRGPLVYCVESADNPGKAWSVVVPAELSLTSHPHQVLDEPVLAIQGEMYAFAPAADGLNVERQTRPITAVPYYAWGNRGDYQMQVWLPTVVEEITLNG